RRRAAPTIHSGGPARFANARPALPSHGHAPPVRPERAACTHSDSRRRADPVAPSPAPTLRNAFSSPRPAYCLVHCATEPAFVETSVPLGPSLLRSSSRAHQSWRARAAQPPKSAGLAWRRAPAPHAGPAREPLRPPHAAPAEHPPTAVE